MDTEQQRNFGSHFFLAGFTALLNFPRTINSIRLLLPYAICMDLLHCVCFAKVCRHAGDEGGS